MFDWLTEVEDPMKSLNRNHQIGKLSIEKMHSSIELGEMSELCLFLSAFEVILDFEEEATVVTSLPIPNDKALQIVLNEIVPHYLDVKRIFLMEN